MAPPATRADDAPLVHPPQRPTAREQSSDPFPIALRSLMPEGVSLRGLSEMTRANGQPVSAMHLSRLSRGVEPPTVAAMEAIAGAVGESPSYFAEYRLAAGRTLLDERGPEGLSGALDRLKQLQDAVGGALPAPKSRRARVIA